MAIFPIIETDDIVQANDKFRIRADKSYISKGEAAITLVEINPGTGTFVPVTGSPIASKNWFMDFQHSSAGDRTVAVRITTDGAPVSLSKTVTVLSEASDYLYSKDSELVAIESDILKYVPEGRSSFKYAHREAQNQILEWLWVNGYSKTDGTRFVKTDFIDVLEVNYWSRYLTLRLIFKDLSNQVDDIFDKKAKMYENIEHQWRTKALLKIDINGDGVVDTYEGFNMTTRRLVRE
jgi:hypothetical protein